MLVGRTYDRRVADARINISESSVSQRGRVLLSQFLFQKKNKTYFSPNRSAACYKGLALDSSAKRRRKKTRTAESLKTKLVEA